MVDPLPLSFPPVLRNPGLTDKLTHLQTVQQQPTPVTISIKLLKREYNEGKRWVRRKDNAHFAGNPHIVAATKADYALQPTQVKATFPEPLPPYLPRNSKLPNTVPPMHDPNSANAGRFSLSLKGMRRQLRRGGFRTESLVRDVESEIVQWLEAGGVFLNPDTRNVDNLGGHGTPIGNTETILEVSRTPLQLVWYTDNDNFARYVIHCCARYHEIVSFSKELSGRRLIYLLRPNVTQPDHHAPGRIDTPPVTDVDYSSQPDTESDHGRHDADSDLELPPNPLPAISEDSNPTSPFIIASPTSARLDDEAWSIVGDTDIDDDESGSDTDSVPGVGSFLATGTDPNVINNRTPRPDLYRRQQASLRRQVWAQGRRSPSSPSHSPVRRPLRRNPIRSSPPSGIRLHRYKSFYEYLFLN